MSHKEGDIIHQDARMLVVKGHYSEDELRRLTGRVGHVRHDHWRHDYYPGRQRQLFSTPRQHRYISTRPGRGAFPVSILILRQLR